MVNVTYPFTFNKRNSGGSSGSSGVTTPDFRITLLKGPRWREGGLFTARLDYADTRNRSGRTYALQRVWYPEGTRLPNADSNWHYLDWQIRDSYWQSMVGRSTGGGYGELSSERTSFYAECPCYDGWLYLEGTPEFGWHTASGPETAIIEPAPVPEGGGETWATTTPTSSGVLRVGSTDPDITVEVYVSHMTDGSTPSSIGELTQLSTGDQTNVQVSADRTYYLRMVAQKLPSRDVRLVYSDPTATLPSTVPTLVSMPLSWLAPEHDGGMPLEKYVVRTALNNTFTKNNISAAQLSASLELRPGAVIWISAENEAGTSLPLMSGRVI